MGFLDFFRRRKIETFEDEEDIEEKKEAEVEPDVSISGQHDIKICKPKTFQQALSAADCMNAGRTVCLNLESIPDTNEDKIDTKKTLMPASTDE